jgi:HEAT repeat protein
MTSLLLAALLAQEEEAIARFKKDYASSRVEERAAAVRGLGGTPGEKTLKALADLLVRDDPTVRVEAAKALGGFSDLAAKATPPLVQALGANKEEAVLVALFDAIGALAQEPAAAAVNKGLGVRETAVAKAAVEAAAKIRSRTSVEPLIDLLEKLEKETRLGRGASNAAPGPGIPGSARTEANREAEQRGKTLRPAVLRALQSITKEKWTKADEWQDWWKKTKATFQVEK